MLSMPSHMSPKTFPPEKSLAANITMKILLPTMFHHMPPQENIVKKLHITDGTLHIFLLQMCPSHMIPHKRVTCEKLFAVRAFMSRIMGFYQMFLP